MVHTTPPSLVIADAHRLFVAGLSKLLAGKFRIITTVSDGRSLVEAALRLRPDLILTELAMPLMNGLEAVHRIRRAMPSMRIVCLSSNSDDDTIRECFQKGASGFIPKTASGAELALGLRRVLHGDIYLSQQLPQSAKLFSDSVCIASPNEEVPLTERQIEVLQLLAEGKSNKEVANALNISIKTAETHRTNIMNKLDLRSITELVRYAVRNNIVEP